MTIDWGLAKQSLLRTRSGRSVDKIAGANTLIRAVEPLIERAVELVVSGTAPPVTFDGERRTYAAARDREYELRVAVHGALAYLAPTFSDDDPRRFVSRAIWLGVDALLSDTPVDRGLDTYLRKERAPERRIRQRNPTYGGIADVVVRTFDERLQEQGIKREALAVYLSGMWGIKENSSYSAICSMGSILARVQAGATVPSLHLQRVVDTLSAVNSLTPRVRTHLKELLGHEPESAVTPYMR